MTSRSNLHGRVLEYLITQAIIETYPVASLTARANLTQKRDVGKLESVEPALLHELALATDALLIEWLTPQFQLSQQASILVDRLPDQNQSDVTDIRLTLPTTIVNLSLKHNHTALKHQRPGTTPLHCGYDRQSSEMQQFQQHYRVVTQQFMQLIGQEKRFSELPDTLIEEYLYSPVCNLVSQFINRHASASHFFQYLIGSTNYYKVIVDTRAKTIGIQPFESIQMPTSVVATVNRQYVGLTFSNGWEISMRLHTASSRIGNAPSLKFDTKALKHPVAATIISYVQKPTTLSRRQTEGNSSDCPLYTHSL